MCRERWLGLCIVVTDAAMRELLREEKTLYDVVKILEEGYDAPRKRKKEIIEKWMDKGNKVYNVVVAKDYNEIVKQNCWVLVHFGKHTR